MISRRTFLQSIAVFLPMIAGRSVAQGVGVDYVRANDYLTLQAAVDAAALIPSKRLYMPAGTYQPAQLVPDDLDVFGDGPEKTQIQLPDAPVIATYGLRLFGKRQRVSGLSLRGGTQGTANVYGISATFGCSEWHLSDICVSGIAGTGTAGGSCFDFYQPSATDGGYSRGVAERLVAENSPNACGYIINAQGNSFRDCRATSCGNTPSRHAWYVQGGYNTFTACIAALSGGYNWHNYAAVPDRAASYNVYQACQSISPTFGHVVVSNINASASNPDVPAGTPLNRGVSFIGCTFRGPAQQGVNLGVPADLADCALEDILSGAGAWVGTGAGGRIRGNSFRQTVLPANNNIVGVVCTSGAIVTDNQFSNWLAGTGIRADGLSLINNNSLDLYGSSTGLYINGPDARRGDNVYQLHGSARSVVGAVV